MTRYFSNDDVVKLRVCFLCLMIALYFFAGVNHFFNPAFYLAIMPVWLPFHLPANYASGVAEITLALLLIPGKTRVWASRLIIAMLFVFLFVIHLPMIFHYYKSDNKMFIISLVRAPMQFALIWWARLYTKPGYLSSFRS